jgi:hypothetical protein
MNSRCNLVTYAIDSIQIILLINDIMNSQFDPRLTRDSPAKYAIDSNNLPRDSPATHPRFKTYKTYAFSHVMNYKCNTKKIESNKKLLIKKQKLVIYINSINIKKID